MTSQWPDNCDANTWQVISNSLDIDFIHGDIHGRSCKKDMYLVEYAWLWWCWFASVPKCEDCIFGSQCITAICIFHIKHQIHRQRLFQDNVFHLHEIWNAILAKFEIKKKLKENKNYKFENLKSFMKTLIDKVSISKMNFFHHGKHSIVYQYWS